MKLTWFQLHYKEKEEIPVSFRNVNVGEYLIGFFRETTLQGFPSVVKQGGIIRKVYWVICIALSIFALQWELNTFLNKFLRWQPATMVKIKSARQLDFPAITLCNNNPVTREWYMAYNYLKQKKGLGYASQQSKGSTTDPSNCRKKRQANKEQSDDSSEDQGGTFVSMAAPMITLFDTMESASSVHYENRSETGHYLCDIVLQCSYNGISCDVQSAFGTTFWSPFHGNCWTFNPGYKKADSPVYQANPTASAWNIKRGTTSSSSSGGILQATQTGPAYGLRLVLNADVDHYLYTTTQVGWRLVVHNQTEMPFPEENGIFIMPGTSTHVGVKISYHQRLGVVSTNYLYTANYSNCVDANELQSDAPNNVFSNILEVAYTPAACLKTCYQYNVMKQCSCFDLSFPDDGAAFSSIPNYESIPPCSYTNETLWACKIGVWQEHIKNRLNCYCPDSCLTYSYETTVSQLKWPVGDRMTVTTVCSTLEDLLSDLVTSDNPNCKNSILASEYKQGVFVKALNDVKTCADGNSTYSNWEETAQFTVGSQFAEVYVYYSDFNHHSVVEYEQTEISDLIAYLGGILGLFFGFSMLTLMEYIMLIFDLVAIAVAKTGGKIFNSRVKSIASVRTQSSIEKLVMHGPVFHTKRVSVSPSSFSSGAIIPPSAVV